MFTVSSFNILLFIKNNTERLRLLLDELLVDFSLALCHYVWYYVWIGRWQYLF